MSPHEVRLLADLVRLCERFASPSGHLRSADPYSALGICVSRRHWVGGRKVKDGSGFRIVDQVLDGTCAPACVLYQATLTEARAVLAAHEPAQLTLEEAV